MAFTFIDRETWRFINTFAPWLSAIGTLAVVITSLYLTLADRSRLRVRAGKDKVESSGYRSPDDKVTYDLISIRVTNSRDKSVFIDEVYWNVGGTITPQVINYTFALGLDLAGPSMLVGSVPTQIYFDLDTFKKHSLPKLAPSLLGSGSRVKIGVTISTGKRFESKVERELEDWLREAANEISV